MLNTTPDDSRRGSSVAHDDTTEGETMTEPLHDVWHRDIAVLTEVCRINQANRGPVDLVAVSETLGIEFDQVRTAALNLERDGYVTLLLDFSGVSHVSDISGDALRAVGLWPTPETAFDRMVAALEAIADNTDEDDDTRSRARKILEALGGAGKQIGLSVSTAVLTGLVT
jgi:hypothetical protein